MLVFACDPCTQATGECEASLSNTGDPMSKTQRKSTAKSSKAIWRNPSQSVTIVRNSSGSGPARSTLAAVPVGPFFLATALQEAAVP